MKTSESWKRALLIFLSLFCFVGLVDAYAQDASGLIKRGAALMDARSGKAENIAMAMEAYEQALKLDPGNAEALWRMSHAYLSQGMEQSSTKEARIAAHNKGIEWGEKAIKTAPKELYAYFWTFGNQGEQMGLTSMAQRPAIIFKMKRNIDTMLEINPSTSPLVIYAKGRFHLELPVFLGGSVDTAIEWLRKAVSVNPDFTMAYVELARAYITKKQYPEAKEVLAMLLSKERKPLFPGDYAVHDRPMGEQLLREVEAKMREAKSQ